ncbi:MAG: GDSL-type esterase/lipase family protein [Verrucomicrobiota bacterium]
MKRTPFLAVVGLLLFLPHLALAAEHNFERWEKDIANFEANDKASQPPKGALLFIGSSTIVRWETLAQDFPEHKIINRAFGGNEICDSTHYAERMIFPYDPKMIFLRAGGNDIHSGKTPEQVFADYKDFVAKIRTKLPDIDIAYIGLSPSVARWKNAEKEKALNGMIEAFTRQNPHLKYIATWDITLGSDGQPRPELFVADKLHLNAEGYKLLIDKVRPFLPEITSPAIFHP